MVDGRTSSVLAVAGRRSSASGQRARSAGTDSRVAVGVDRSDDGSVPRTFGGDGEDLSDKFESVRGDGGSEDVRGARMEQYAGCWAQVSWAFSSQS